MVAQSSTSHLLLWDCCGTVKQGTPLAIWPMLMHTCMVYVSSWTWTMHHRPIGWANFQNHQCYSLLLLRNSYLGSCFAACFLCRLL